MALPDGFYDVPQGKLAVVVTHLEMTAPAALRGAPLPDGLAFKPFSPDLAAYRDLFRRIGQDWLWFGRLELTDAELSEVLNDPKVPRYTLEKDGRPEALLELDFRQDRECELAYFGLTEALIGTGAGAYLMDRAISLAWAEDITRFHVHTCTTDSPQALGFYQRSGFTAYRRQIEIAPDPRLKGLHPEHAAPGIPFV
jgi:GNAT superfamily N-acetyltransferase